MDESEIKFTSTEHLQQLVELYENNNMGLEGDENKKMAESLKKIIIKMNLRGDVGNE